MIDVVTYLAKNLLTARRARGMTQQDIAAAVGVARGTYFNWENDIPESAPNYLQVVNLGRALDVHPTRLLFEDAEMFRRSFAVPPPRRGAPVSDDRDDEDDEPRRKGRPKLSDADRVEIVVAVDQRGESLRAVAKRHGVAWSTVRRVLVEMRAQAARPPKQSRVTVRGQR